MIKKTKFFGFMVVVLALMSSCGMFSCTPTEVTVREDDDGEWRIYDNSGNNQGSWTVEEGDIITWEVTGSDMLFSFPLDMGTYFELNDQLFADIDSVYTGPDNEERRIHLVEEGEFLRLTVQKLENSDLENRESGKVDTVMIDYDIYVFDAEKYVIGNSPPYIIIQRSY
ncbi:MAG: hypothetical protein GVY20_06760 [Bacteroidetes bacterium]|jgi:hypothetical protein|nr:hypothetical protein [Bacteroidota bacterium]